MPVADVACASLRARVTAAAWPLPIPTPISTRLPARALRAGRSAKTHLDAGVSGLRADPRADIATLETRLTVRFFGGLVAVGGAIVAAVELLQAAP